MDLSALSSNNFPKAYHVISKFSNIEGGYKLTNNKFNYRPTYYNSDDRKYLFYDNNKWNIGDELGGGT